MALEDHQAPVETEEKEPEKKGFLEDPKKIRNTRSIAILIVVFASPFLVFGIMDNFTIQDLLSYNFGIISIYTTFVNYITTKEVRLRGFEDEVDSSKDISEKEIDVIENGEKIKENRKEASIVMHEYNREMQDLKNEELTQYKIGVVEEKITKLELKKQYVTWNKLKQFLNWRIEKLERKVERWEKVPIINKSFKPYKLERLLTTGNIKRYSKKSGDSEIDSQPQNVDKKKALYKLPLKGLSMSFGSILGAVFFIKDWDAFLLFFATFASIQIITILSQYPLTRYKTKTEYRNALDTKLKLQQTIITNVKELLEFKATMKAQTEALRKKDKDLRVRTLGRNYIVYLKHDRKTFGKGETVDDAYDQFLEISKKTEEIKEIKL